jgi:hypothetical protein
MISSCQFVGGLGNIAAGVSADKGDIYEQCD